MKLSVTLLCCLFQCLPLWSADFQKAKIVSIGKSSISGAPTVINSQPVQPLAGPPIPGSGTLIIPNSAPVVLLTVEMGGVQYTAQYFPRNLYGKHGFQRKAISLGAEVEARVDSDIRRGNFLRHWTEDELVLQTPEGSTVLGVVVQKSLTSSPVIPK